MTPTELQERGLRVKPLEWEPFTHYSTDDDGGPMEGIRMAHFAWKALHYRIIQKRNSGLFLLNGRSNSLGLAVPYLEAAKAAAEADHAARIAAQVEVMG